MPTCLLQEQLEILVPELSAAIPENRSVYEKLLPAAAELHATRQQHLTDEQIEALATGFDRAVGTELSTRLPHTGRLLGCVVADELAGCELAVTSLHAWLTDAIRFPGSMDCRGAGNLAPSPPTCWSHSRYPHESTRTAMKSLNPSEVSILVVEDDPDVLCGTVRLMEKRATSVDEAISGEDALRSVQHRHADVILLDRDLPGLDGIEVCRRIKADQALKAIFCHHGLGLLHAER